jgi:N6-adenosine-specific RNA methylase IME4/ParB-like chromosome segregation protein Spo0J
MPQAKLIINQEYRSYLPRPNKEDYERLRNSIKEKGYYPEYPIIANENYEILDGYTRYQICQELSIEPKIVIKNFKDKYEEAKFVIDTNIDRRHLNPFQLVEVGMKLLELEKQRAKERQGKRTDLTSEPNDSEVEKKDIKATEQVAKHVGVSTKTFERAKKVIEEAPEEMKDSVRKGKTSITYAYKQVLNKERNTETPELPKDKFNVILADPPWEYDLELRGSPDMHYQTKPLEDICALKVPSAEDAVLFLWATAPKLKEAIRVMQEWGFLYKTNMVWIKDKIGTGYYVRGQHELLLIGIKGNIGVPQESNRPSSIIKANRLMHSKKPTETYDIIERMYPNQKYLELFARNKRSKWESWGNEVE